MGVPEKELKFLQMLLDQKVTELHVLYNVSTIIGGSLDKGEIFGELTSFLRKTLSVSALSVLEKVPGKDRLLLAYSSKTKASQPPIAFGDGVPGATALEGRPQFMPNAGEYEGFIHFPGERRAKRSSVIAVPLKLQEELSGILVVEKTRGRFISDDIDLVVMIALLVAIGLEKCGLFEKTVQLSQLDGLTGLLNHRVFMEKLAEEFKRKTRTKRPVSLLMMDIDKFKLVNDTYGHSEGDEVLRELSALMAETIRDAPTDILARYGGEEFALLLVDTDLPQALCVAERIRLAVFNKRFGPWKESPGERLTISVGVVAYRDKSRSENDMIVEADRAMYHSKKNGRNRTSFVKEGSVHLLEDTPQNCFKRRADGQQGS